MRRLLGVGLTAASFLVACQGILGIEDGTARNADAGAGTGGVPEGGGTGGVSGSAGDSGPAGSGGTTGGSGGTAGVGGKPGNTCNTNPSCVLPPPRSNASANTNGTELVIEVHQVFLGDTDRQGAASPDAWRQFGYNLDRLISGPNDANHCALVNGASPDVKTDGDGGIDNSFGENLLPTILSLDPGAGTETTQAIENGRFTGLFHIVNIIDPGQRPDQNGLSGAVFVGAPWGGMGPAFDGSDVWDVTFESVHNGDITQPMVSLADSYVAQGTWVSGAKVTVVLPLVISGLTVWLPIQGAVVTLQNFQGINVEGTIAGQIATDDVTNAVTRVAGSIDPTLCTGATIDSILQQVRGASDIMLDGSNGDPNTTCNAISIGLGFTGVVANLGGVAGPAGPPPDPCQGAGGAGGMGGAGGAGGSGDGCMPSGATSCTDLGTGDAACDSCIQGSCCNEILACLQDTACDELLTCLSTRCGTATDVNACVQQNCSTCATQNSLDLYNAMGTCMQNSCGTACGGGVAGAGGAPADAGTD